MQVCNTLLLISNCAVRSHDISNDNSARNYSGNQDCCLLVCLVEILHMSIFYSLRKFFGNHCYIIIHICIVSSSSQKVVVVHLHFCLKESKVFSATSTNRSSCLFGPWRAAYQLTSLTSLDSAMTSSGSDSIDLI